MKNLPVSLILALLFMGCEVNLSLDDGRGDAGDPRTSVPEAAGELREQIPVYKVSLPLEDADPDEPEDLERILAVAVDKEEIEKREVAGSGLLYLPGEPMPFSGWKRESHPDGRVKSLVRIRYGREDGPYRTWREDGCEGLCGQLSRRQANGPLRPLGRGRGKGDGDPLPRRKQERALRLLAPQRGQGIGRQLHRRQDGRALPQMDQGGCSQGEDHLPRRQAGRALDYLWEGWLGMVPHHLPEWRNGQRASPRALVLLSLRLFSEIEKEGKGQGGDESPPGQLGGEGVADHGPRPGLE